MMASYNHIFIGILILQIYAHAAPSDVGKLEEIAKVETANDTQTTQLSEVEDNSNDTKSTNESTREKRYYNPFGFGFPPINPVIYPSYNKRDDFPNTGTYGLEDPIAQIHRRVQEIANVVRQPQLPPPIPHVPIFYPVLFVPPFDCACKPTNPDTTGPSPNNNDGSLPNVTNRFPEMEDERQNWGFVTNEIGDNNRNGNAGANDDFSRPISLVPINANRPNIRPPPPVDRGTTQGEVGNNQSTPEGDQAPPSSEARPPPGPGAQRPPFNGQRPSAPRPPAARPPPQSGYPGPPSPCDGAILTCCHRPHILYDCFAAQGCPNIPTYGNPCEPSSILRVIEKFQYYYGNRSG